VSTSDERTTFSPTLTPILLRSADPPVVVESVNGLREAPPTHVERLGDRLAEGIDFAFIPQNLQAGIYL